MIMLIIGFVGLGMTTGFHIATKGKYPLVSGFICLFVGIIGGAVLSLIS